MTPADYERERQTRKQRIDPRLRNAGWKVVPFTDRDVATYTSGSAVEEFGTDQGPADYALCIDGEALVLDSPLRFRILPGVLRVRIARKHPGASPSMAMPETLLGTAGALLAIAAGHRGPS